MNGLTVVRTVTFHRQARGRKRLKDNAPEPLTVHGQRIPRRVQLLALAHHFEALLREGKVASYSEIARRTGITRARVSQITRLLDLPPERQEELLASSPTRELQCP